MGVLNKMLIRVISIFMSILLVIIGIPVFAEEDGVEVWNFEEFAVGENPYKEFANCEIAEYKNSKAMKITADKLESTYRFRKLIMGEYCVSFDIASPGGNFNGRITSRSDVSSVRNLLVFKNGVICLPSGKEFGHTIGKDYTNIAICVNPQRKTLDLYINKKCVLRQSYVMMISDKNFLINFVFSAVNDREEVYLDNIVMHSTSVKTDKCFVYNKGVGYVALDKTKLADSPNRIYSHYFGSDKSVVRTVADRNAIHMRSGLMTIHGEKLRLSDMPYMENGEYMVTADAVEKLLETTVTKEGKNITVGDKANLKIDEREMNVKGSKITANAAPTEKNGVLYLPLYVLAKNAFSKHFYADDTTTSAGMVIIGDNDYIAPTTEDKLEMLNEYLLYERPLSEDVMAYYRKSSNYVVHPRIMMNSDDVVRIRKEVVENPVKKEWYRRLIEYADDILGVNAVVYEYRDNVSIQTVMASFETYMLILGMAYQLTGDVRYADGAWKQIESVLGFPDWEPTNHLSVVLCATGFAVAYDWLYDYLTPGQRKLMEKNVYENCLWWANETYHKTENSFEGVVNEQNHNIICNSGITLAALAFVDVYPELCAKLTSEAVRSVEYFIDRFAPNGALYDGPSYTQISVDYLSRFLSTLETVLGTQYTLEATEGLDKITEFLQCVGSDVASYNFGDAVSGKASSGGLFYLINLYKQKGLRDLVAAEKRLSNNKDIMLVSSLLWYDVADESGKDGIQLDGYYDANGQVVVTSRDRFGDGQVFTGIKAGSTARQYSIHLDAGSFIFDALGVRWAYDLGSDSYQLPGYMQPMGGRFNIFRLRPEGHNTIVINPNYEPGFVLDSFAPITTYESKVRGVKTVVDMSAVLADHAKSAKRGFLFTDDRTSLVVRDEIEVSKPSEVYWNMYTKASAEIDGDTVILSDRSDLSKKIMIEFASSVPGTIVFEDGAPMKTSPEILGQNANTGFYRLMYKTLASGKVDITAKITPLIYSANSVAEYNKPIDSWQIPDGGIEEIPTLDKLVIGETEYDTKEKNIVIPCETEDSPVLEIKAESEKYIVEVVLGENVSSNSYVYIAKPDKPEMKYKYFVSYNPKIKRRYVKGYDLVDIKSAKASEEPQADLGHTAEKVLDNNFSTRWAAEREQTMLLELSEPSEIDTYLMSLYVGDTRTTSFDVYVSADGEKYEMVFSGVSSGKTLDFEKYDIGKHTAKFVRIDFHGSSTATWNSVTEIAVGRKKIE